MTNALDKIVEQLRVQETEIQNEAQQLKQQLATMTKQLAQVQTAIHSLAGKLTGPTASTSKPNNKPSLSIDEIQQIILTGRRQQPSITDVKLFEQVEAELVAKGGKKHGLKAKFQKVLSEVAKQEEMQPGVHNT